MNEEKAKFILSAYRPGHEDRDDPEFAAALALVQSEPELQAWLDDQIAITVHSHGRGLVYYIGAYLDEDAQQALMDHIVSMAAIRAVMETPAGVEACIRVAPDGTRITILVTAFIT